MFEAEHKQHRTCHEKKDPRLIEGRRITQQLPCHPQPAKHKLKYDPPSKQSSQIDTFRTLLTRKDRQKESQSKLQHRQVKRGHDEVKQEKEKMKKEGSKSRSKSKGLVRSKSLKQLVKKSKSMVRLEPRQECHRDERKSLSPQGHVKSTISYGDRKHCKSNYNSKTTREMISQITTEREKSKTKIKLAKVVKKPKAQAFKKPLQNKINKKKTEKENIKLEPKQKKFKKEKRVLISEEHSKVRRECEDWQLSLNEDEFLDPRLREVKQKQRQKNSNIVDVPKRKQRLSLNPSHPRKPSLKNKTEVQLDSYKSQKKEIEQWAAIKIQKVFRGYLTRKYIRQCFEHNAAVKIQKIWRGYLSRKQYLRLRKQKIREQFINLSPLKIEQDKMRIFQQEDYLIEKEESKSNLKSSMFNEKWAEILQEILQEKSVSHHIKKKIELFLQVQQKSINEFELLKSNRSPSARSSISSQVIHNQMASQRHFLEKQRMKKIKHNEHLFLSPKENTGNKGMSSSPQGQFCSPQHKFRSSSPARSSSELLISNLKSIQKAHRDRLQNKANDEKEQLNKMLIKNKLSPRTHEKKYKEVDLFLESELERFNESINQIVKNCMLYGQDNEELIQDTIITPKKELAQLPSPADISPHHQPIRGEEMSMEFREYYQAQQEEETGQKVQRLQPFDTTYQFIEEYLISLIDFVRQYENGSVVSKIISYAHKPISREMDTILRNLKQLTENSEEDENESSFQLPMYKYIDMQEEIIETHLIQKFNAVYPKLRLNEMSLASSLQDAFIKMIADSMNEALNALRPSSYPFLESKLSSLNVFKGLEKISFEGQISEEEMQYQYTCAQAMNKIFYWNKLQWGKIIRFQEDMQNFNETRHFLQREEEASIISIFAQDKWVFFEELIEIIGVLSEELFVHLIFEEITTFYSLFLQRAQNTSRSLMKIEAPNSRTYFLP